MYGDKLVDAFEEVVTEALAEYHVRSGYLHTATIIIGANSVQVAVDVTSNKSLVYTYSFSSITEALKFLKGEQL